MIILVRLPVSDNISDLINVKGNYIDASIWSALEPAMAVVCCCIPSLRPLFSIIAQATRKVKVGSYSKSTWTSGNSYDGGFNHLEEQLDAGSFGHDVSVRGGELVGRNLNSESHELPQGGIQVKQEVDVTSYRIDYQDHLF